MKARLPVIFVTDEYIDNPSHFGLELSADQVEKINKAKEILEENKWMFSIHLDIGGIEAVKVDFDDDDKEVVEPIYDISDERIIVYPSGNMYVIAQDDSNAQIQWESCAFGIENGEIVFEESVKY